MTAALKFVVNSTFHKARLVVSFFQNDSLYLQLILYCLSELCLIDFRASTLSLPHGDVMTPVYMPVGTKGSMKGLKGYF